LTLRLNYDKYGKHQKTGSISEEAGRPKSQKQSPNKSMTTLTTNRFFTKALRTLCCASALTACSAWATVVTWQLSPGTSGSVGATKALPQSGYTTAAWGVDKTPITDASHAFLFRTAPGSGVSETSAAVAGTLNNKPQASDTYIQMASQSTLSQGGGQISARSTQPDESSLFATSNTPVQATVQLGGAMASAFDEEFVSVPTVQFASSAMGSRDISMTSVNSVTSVPEMSALFPIVGLIAAVSCTQILRRRRAAQQSAPRSRA
jgi:hypothetical protein